MFGCAKRIAELTAERDAASLRADRLIVRCAAAEDRVAALEAAVLRVVVERRATVDQIASDRDAMRQAVGLAIGAAP